jgi:hypothetical protein
MILADYLDRVRDHYGIAPSVRSRAYDLAFQRLELQVAFGPGDVDAYKSHKVDAYDRICDEKKLLEPGELRREQFLDAIRSDLGRLLGDVRAQAVDADRVLLLIDNLHELEDLAPIVIRCVNEWGLGAREAPAPLVISYVTRGDIGDKIQEEIKKRSKFFRREALQPFRGKVESRLAYTQFLLTREPPYVINARADKRKAVEDYFVEVHREIRGIPYYLYQEEMKRCIRFMLAGQVLVQANP